MSLELNRAKTGGRCQDFAGFIMDLQLKPFDATAAQLLAVNTALERCNAVFRDLAARRSSNVAVTSVETL